MFVVSRMLLCLQSDRGDRVGGDMCSCLGFEGAVWGVGTYVFVCEVRGGSGWLVWVIFRRESEHVSCVSTRDYSDYHTDQS